VNRRLRDFACRVLCCVNSSTTSAISDESLPVAHVPPQVGLAAGNALRIPYVRYALNTTSWVRPSLLLHAVVGRSA
jgi:hypothetical protein